MKNLTEKRTLTNVHLTAHQKQALATVFSASSASLAYEHIATGVSNLMGAAKILDDLGLVVIHNDSEITVTEAGKTVMRSEGLLDDSDALTADGQKAIDTAEGPESTPQQPEVGGSVEPSTELPMESFALIREINFYTSVNKN